MTATVLFLKSAQGDLFARQGELFDVMVPIRGHTRKDGTTVKPSIARRHRRMPDAPAVPINHPGPAHVALEAVEPEPAIPPLAHVSDEEIIEEAILRLDAQLSARREDNTVLDSPEKVKRLIKLRLARSPHEIFAALWLDNKHRLLKFDELFRGTIDGASVHPRDVAAAALNNNAAAVIFAHNHPSGVTEPSQADLRITQRLRESLDLIDVKVLDHIVTGEGAGVSFAERGLL